MYQITLIPTPSNLTEHVISLSLTALIAAIAFQSYAFPTIIVLLPLFSAYAVTRARGESVVGGTVAVLLGMAAVLTFFMFKPGHVETGIQIAEQATFFNRFVTYFILILAHNLVVDHFSKSS